jgi:hypothetical protein
LADARIRHVRLKRLAAGAVAHYWEVPTKYRAKGCPLVGERLGGSEAEIIARAGMLNASLDAWRAGTDTGALIPGTIKWLRREYEKDEHFTRLARKSRRTASYALGQLENFRLESGHSFGDLHIADIARPHAKLIRRKIAEDRGEAMSNSVMRYARLLWNFAIDELELQDVVKNPFQRMRIRAAGGKTYAPTRVEVTAFIAKADEFGHRSAGTAVMLAFELCQRAGDIIGTRQDDGSVAGISWHDYRSPAEHGYRAAIRVRQHKTGELIWVPLYDADDAGRYFELFPGLIDRLDGTPRRGPLIVTQDKVRRSRTAQIYPAYTEYSFGHMFREIARAAGLPAAVQFRAMRHGGMTELGDSEATDQEMMSLSGHTNRATLKVYSRRSAIQVRNAARKRLALRMDMEKAAQPDGE